MAITVYQPTLTELCMALERMRLQEHYHQKQCRALYDQRPCVSCDEHEAAWLSADRAITAFLAGVERGDG